MVVASLSTEDFISAIPLSKVESFFQMMNNWLGLPHGINRGYVLVSREEESLVSVSSTGKDWCTQPKIQLTRKFVESVFEFV